MKISPLSNCYDYQNKQTSFKARLLRDNSVEDFRLSRRYGDSDCVVRAIKECEKEILAIPSEDVYTIKMGNLVCRDYVYEKGDPYQRIHQGPQIEVTRYDGKNLSLNKCLLPYEVRNPAWSGTNYYPESHNRDFSETELIDRARNFVKQISEKHGSLFKEVKPEDI